MEQITTIGGDSPKLSVFIQLTFAAYASLARRVGIVCIPFARRAGILDLALDDSVA
jgi:hypothetical protein